MRDSRHSSPHAPRKTVGATSVGANDEPIDALEEITDVEEGDQKACAQDSEDDNVELNVTSGSSTNPALAKPGGRRAAFR